jgi:hypothetical protein
MSDDVVMQVTEGVAWVTLNRPDSMNAINNGVREAMPRLLDQAQADDAVRVVVVRGAGPKAFCTGADIREFNAVASLALDRQRRVHANWINACERLRKPVIASSFFACAASARFCSSVFSGAGLVTGGATTSMASARVFSSSVTRAPNLVAALSVAPSPVAKGTMTRRGFSATAKVGGRGHVIGDRASACDIGLRALRAVMADLDHHGKLGPLGAAILNALLFTEPEQLISWSVHAAKTEIASLAVTVFAG